MLVQLEQHAQQRDAESSAFQQHVSSISKIHDGATARLEQELKATQELAMTKEQMCKQLAEDSRAQLARISTLLTQMADLEAQMERNARVE